MRKDFKDKTTCYHDLLQPACTVMNKAKGCNFVFAHLDASQDYNDHEKARCADSRSPI